MGNTLIYVASPYSADTKWDEHQRYLKVMKFVASMMNKGILIYSPIVHCHEMARCFDLPRDAEWWRKFNFDMIKRADEVWVLKLPGWEESVGVAAEIIYAQEIGKAIRYYEGDSKYGWEL